MSPKPPKIHDEFIARFPKLGKAWELLRAGAQEAGPLDEQTARLVKLGIAIGAMREGAVHSAARQAIGSGCAREEIEQVVALAASTIGLPSAVAAYTWVRDTSVKKKGRSK
ncbi:MAG: carboxymuconolactone decarboxylase family protein [Planctomycetes bacterium]|nr:carboxymuconolactone decarboxylase family protein [Planctomycetota bacterium]